MNLRDKLRWDLHEESDNVVTTINLNICEDWNIKCSVEVPEWIEAKEWADWFFWFLSKYFIPFWAKLLLDTKTPKEQMELFLDSWENDIKELKELLDKE